jgi:uncharacterized repeat protein (TIGR01451 family)
MQPWNRLPRALLFIALLTGLLGGMLAPTLVDESVSAAPMAQAATNVVISEFRTRGPSLINAATDEFIEIYNPTNSTISIAGLKLRRSSACGFTLNDIYTFPSGVNLLPGQYYLVASQNYTGSVIPDITLATNMNISDTGGIAITDALNTPIDQIGMCATTAYKEGATLADLSTTTGQSYERKLGGTSDSCQDTIDNLSDFQLITPSNPQNASTPRRLCGVAADLSLVQIVSNTTPNVGTAIVFTITVTNSGPNDATNVTVKDLLPAGFSFDTPSTAVSIGTYDKVSGIWNVGTMSSATSEMLQIFAIVDTGGVKTNWAEVWSSDQIDPDSIAGNSSITEDDDDSATVTPPTIAGLNITNTVNNPNPNVGTNVVFTITVNNPSASPYPATNVRVAALLPSGLTYVSYSSTSGTYNGISGNWTSISDLAIGASATLNVTARVVTSNPPPYSATVTSNEFLPSTSTVIINNPLSGEANLSLTHDPVVVSTSAADQVALKLKLHNAGPDKATSVPMSRTPAVLEHITAAQAFGRSMRLQMARTQH